MIRSVLLALVAAGLASGCGDDDAHQHADAGDTVDCTDETRDDDFVAGLAKTGAGGLKFELTSADPAPPVKGDNHWTLTVTRDDAPVDGLTVTVRPWMPDHGHGTQVKPVITAEGAGVYDVNPVNLRMAGFWEITLSADDGAGTTDSVKLGFCITG